jgi:guanylate kinase
MSAIKVSKKNKKHKGTLFLISASSGAGKTSLVKQVVTCLGEECTLERVVTYTTRVPRSGEVTGVDYHFISQPEFERKIEEGFFLEWSREYGAYYGSPKQELSKIAQGISLFLIVNQEGFRKIFNLAIGKKAVGIWIDVPSLDVLEERLIKRGEGGEVDLMFRLALAKKENQNRALLTLFKYKITNEKEQEAVTRLLEIVKSEVFKIRK